MCTPHRPGSMDSAHNEDAKQCTQEAAISQKQESDEEGRYTSQHIEPVAAIQLPPWRTTHQRLHLFVQLTERRQLFQLYVHVNLVRIITTDRVAPFRCSMRTQIVVDSNCCFTILFVIANLVTVARWILFSRRVFVWLLTMMYHLAVHLWKMTDQNNAYMRPYTRASLFQIMACHLFDSKPLSDTMLASCLLDPSTQISMEFQLKYKNCLIKKKWK